MLKHPLCVPKGALAALIVSSLASAPGCGSSPEATTPTPTGAPVATPTPEVPVGLRCDEAAAPAEGLGSVAAPAVLSPVAMAAFHAPAVGDREAQWVACGPGDRVLAVPGDAWAGIQVPVAGEWRVTALVDGVPVAQELFAVSDLPGDVVRFDLDQVGLAHTPHDLGALPWPSELYRDTISGRILLSEGSVEGAVPDALYSLVPWMAPGIQRGWASMPAFPVTSALHARTEGLASVDALEAWQDPQLWQAEGAPAILVELEDGEVTAASRRLPLHWRYVRTYDSEVVTSADDGSVTTNVLFERNGLSMWLPPGQVLEEDREYLWILTTAIGGARGPWMPSQGFTTLMTFPGADEAEEVAAFRRRVEQAVEVLPDLPHLGVVAGAAWFRTQRFTHQLDAVRGCAREGACQGLDLSAVGGVWPGPAPSFEDLHVYWDEVPAGPNAREHRRIDELFDHELIDACHRLYPPDAYRLVAFGTYVSPSFLGTEPDPLDPDQPLREVFVEDAAGRLVTAAAPRLRFTLVLPKAPPAVGDRYPVVAFVHGLGQDQSDIFKVAEYLAPQGFAVLAIDQLSHGSRYDGPAALAAELGIAGASGSDAEPHTDQLNNLWSLEAELLDPTPADILAWDATDDPWGPGAGTDPGTGDGLDDARTTAPYDVLSVLGFFRGLQNFRGMGDNFRQLSVDLLQLERMLRDADLPGGLNAWIERWDPAQTPLATGLPLLHGRSLGSIAVGVHLGVDREARAAVLGVPGAGIGVDLAAASPFVGAILVIADDVLSCLPNKCESWVDTQELSVEIPVPAAEEYLGRGDPFTHLVEGLLEQGDPLAVAARLKRGARSGPANLLMQHVCDDEVVPNASTEGWVEALGLQALAPIDVGPRIAAVPAEQIGSWLPTYDAALDHPQACPPDPAAPPRGRRQSARGNLAEDTTQVLLSYCPGSHSGVYDRDDVTSARYQYYPDGPFPHGAALVFPTLAVDLPLSDPFHAAREAAVEFLLTAARGEVPVAVAPEPPQSDDTDSDGLPWAHDPCPVGANAVWWEEGGDSCASLPSEP